MFKGGAAAAREFDRVLDLALTTEQFKDPESYGDSFVLLNLDEGAQPYGNSYRSERLAKLIKCIFQILPIERDGYPLIEVLISNYAQKPARERMAARKELRDWLKSHSIDPEEFIDGVQVTS